MPRAYALKEKGLKMLNRWKVVVHSIRSLAVKGSQDNGSKNKDSNLDSLNCDGEPPPSLEEIRCWGKSFDKLMRSSAGRKVFRDFLRCEYSEENILFWLACEELKKETNPDVVEEKARFIYEDYISILSPKEVSLDSRVREIVNRNMVAPTPHTFDEAQLQIYTLMHRDSYPRFVNSSIYKQLAQLNNNEDGNSGANSGAATPTTRKQSSA
ncbi:regulator of G protein signaling double hit [Lycorma delicatula]|uniref:regulator of G protein signaling double hit n=1 Tax=Lycorma delicatula TaxID=130591 RepID=UPI003F519E68